MTRAVMLFARSPRAEAAAKGLGPSAEALFAAVALDWSRAARDCSAEIFIACAPAHTGDFEGLGFRSCLVQEGMSFGSSLALAARAVFERGFGNLLITGIDAPPPSARALERAFATVERDESRAAISPSTDGGVNVIVLGREDVALLATFRVGERDLARRCRDYFGAAVTILESATDIDSALSFSRARSEIGWRRYRPLLSSPHVGPAAVSGFASTELSLCSSLRAPPPSA